MRAVAAAYKKRSLDDFTAALSKYSAQLKADPVIFSHLDALYDSDLLQYFVLAKEEVISVRYAFAKGGTRRHQILMLMLYIYLLCHTLFY